MNIKNLKTAGRVPFTRIIMVLALAIVFVACEKDDDYAAMNAAKTTESAKDFKRGSSAPAPGNESIAEIAIGAGFDELVAALVFVDEKLDAGLVNLFLNGTDQFTVFAPTDDAFKALYKVLNIDEISDLPAELVLDVLFYHVTEGRRAANSVVPPARLRKITTLLGEYFSVSKEGKIYAIGNEANIVAPNISASNGIIHVIDAVILPF